MDNMENKTMKPECNIKGDISFYDLCMVTQDESFTYGYVYIGYGTIHSVKGIRQESLRDRHFYKKIN